MAQKTIWTRGNLKEAFPEIVTPLSATLTESSLNWAAREQFRTFGNEPPRDYISTKWIYGRLYFNLSESVKLSHEIFGSSPEFLAYAFGGLYTGEFGLPRLTIKQRMAILLRLLRAMKIMKGLPQRFSETSEKAKNNAMEMKRLDFSKLKMDELTKLFLTQLERWKGVLLVHLLLFGAALGFHANTRKYARDWLPKEKQHLFDNLLVGLGDNMVFNQNREIWKLAQEARNEQKVQSFLLGAKTSRLGNYQAELKGTRFLELFDEFLNKFGHRPPFELDLSQPRWWEDPTPLLLTIRAHLRGDGVDDPDKRFREQVERRKMAEEEVAMELSNGIGKLVPLKKRIFLSTLKNLQKFTSLRDNSRYYLVLQRWQVRRILVEMGRRLHELGVFEDSKHIDYLTEQELLALLDGKIEKENARLLVKKRMTEAEEFKKLVLPDIITGELILSELSTSKPQLQAQLSAELLGIGISPGKVSGTVRVIMSPAEFHKMQYGEILVAPWTDPAWTALFSLARGVIVEVGGALSHSAIVARECGIPGVASIQNATMILHDGDMVSVDGQSGKVVVEGRR